MASTEQKINYSELIKEVLTKEGSLSSCYQNFHNYSLLNSIWAMIQMQSMGLPITPIACGSKWRELGRTIKDHRKITLCMPVFFEVTDENGNKVLDANGKPKTSMYYKYAQNWYCLAQTDGKSFDINDLDNKKYKKEFSFKKMLNKLGILLKEFELIDGNCQGYTHVVDNKIAINPMAEHSAMTIIHEVAHVLLHKNSKKPANVKELEAETTAYIVGSMLGVSEKELSESRGYIQNWYKNNKEIPQDSANEIIKTADKIYKAGLVVNDKK